MWANPSAGLSKGLWAIRGCLRAASRSEFRVLHFSVQGDHLHLVVESRDAETLSSGARGLAIRVARGVNRALARTGPVWGDRYHTHELKTPRETRNAIVYVLMNFRKHRPQDRRPIDPCSSAAWFDGFRTPPPSPRDPAPTARPRTWLASAGWRRHGLVAWSECPRAN